jgi:hypothetical protein
MWINLIIHVTVWRGRLEKHIWYVLSLLKQTQMQTLETTIASICIGSITAVHEYHTQILFVHIHTNTSEYCMRIC